MPSKAEKMREQLKKRREEAYQRKDEGAMFRNYFRTDLGQDIPLWKPKAGSHIFDVIPYTTGDRDPRVPEGELQDVLDIYVHRGIGGSEDSFVCPARNYDLPCPICEHITELKNSGEYDDDLISSLQPKRRVIYNVIVWDTEEEKEKGVQVYEVAHWFMERHLAALSKSPRYGGMIYFSDPSQEGKSVEFEIKQKGDKVEFVGHKFSDRDYDIPDEYLDNAFSLDQLIYIPEYDELYKALHGHERGGSPSTTSKRTVGRGRQVEEQTEEQEEPQTQDDNCPGGGEFGVDIEQLDYCPKCPEWDACNEEHTRLQSSQEETKSRPGPKSSRPGGRGSKPSGGGRLRRARP